jgi:hypothetical protein
MYLFINLRNNTGFFCDESVWLNAVDIGKNNGWMPEGSVFDFNYVLDDNCDETDEMLQKLFILITVNNRYTEWNGDFIEKENQIVTEKDSTALYNALIASGENVNGRLLSFLSMGSFRISDY